jgi:transposase InsO family protein
LPRRRRRGPEQQQAQREQAERNREIRISDAYTTPGHPIAFSAPNRVAKFFKISPAKAKKILQSVEGYTLHREFKQPKIYNPYYVHKRREQIQGDLIDVSRMADSNGGITFLLVLIDIFTKRLWVFPLKDKKAANTDRALKSWIRSLDVLPKKIMTDRGTEFTNNRVQQLLRSHRIKWQPANGTLKACIAERVNKSLQILIYKYLSQNETVNYIDELSNLVKTYNERGHRTLEGMTPLEADRPENESRVQEIFHEKYEKMARNRKKPKFKIGDLVRIKTDPKKITSSARAYAEQFHGEYFNIMRINRTLPIPMYYLRSTDNGDLIEGGFYAEELQKISGDVYKIERVLEERTENGRRELKVKWKYFGEDWNEWIPAENVTRVF